MNEMINEMKKNAGIVEKHPVSNKYNKTKERKGFKYKSGDIIKILKKTNELKYSLIQPERLSKKKNGIINFVPGDSVKIRSLYSQTGSDKTVVYDLKILKSKNTQFEQDGSKVKNRDMRISPSDLERWISKGIVEVRRNNKVI